MVKSPEAEKNGNTEVDFYRDDYYSIGIEEIIVTEVDMASHHNEYFCDDGVVSNGNWRCRSDRGGGGVIGMMA